MRINIGNSQIKSKYYLIVTVIVTKVGYVGCIVKDKKCNASSQILNAIKNVMPLHRFCEHSQNEEAFHKNLANIYSNSVTVGVSWSRLGKMITD